MPWGRDLVTRGCLERMTPVLMTALSAGVALVPLMIDAASPGKEILHPVAVTIFGGLISATLLDAFVTPLFVLAFGRNAVESLRKGRSKRNPDAGSARFREPILLNKSTENENAQSSCRACLVDACNRRLCPTHKHGHGGVEKGPNGGLLVEAGDYHIGA